MSLIAGVFSRDPRLDVPDAAVIALRAAMSRTPGETVITLRRPGVAITKVDLGAFGDPGHIELPGGTLAAVAGEPLLHCGAATRVRDIEELAEACHAGSEASVLRDARGTFCGAVFDGRRRRLTLFSDNFGIRPLYIGHSGEWVVFASALRIIEQSGLIPLTLSERAVTEAVGFGFPLADRTPYHEVQLLRPAEIAQVERDYSLSTYRDWAAWASPPQYSDVEAGLDETYGAFRRAVEIRLRSDTVTAAFLSGGLDSRCVVAVLRDLGSTVYTFNASIPETADQRLGAAFAAACQTHHTEVPPAMGSPAYVPRAMRAWERLGFGAPQRAERPLLLWSGDGGSVGVGYVYVTPDIVQHLRSGDTDGAISAFFRRQGIGLTARLLARDTRRRLRDCLWEGTRQELGRYDIGDPVRAFYLFLLHNDQHRHLAPHFENLDLDRVEFQLPFFDSDFMASMQRVKPDDALRHAFYVQWLSRFPAAVSSIPWQAYPGHVPCPHPLPPGTHVQWDRTVRRIARARRRREILSTAASVIASVDFPKHLLRRSALARAGLAHAIGVRDQEYVIRAASTYHTYWRAARRTANGAALLGHDGSGGAARANR